MSGPSGATGRFDVSEHQAASVAWCIGCSGGSSTKANFGPLLVQKCWHHKVSLFQTYECRLVAAGAEARFWLIVLRCLPSLVQASIEDWAVGCAVFGGSFLALPSFRGLTNACGKSGGLVMMWKEGTKVEIKSYSGNHIDSFIHAENDKPIQFTGFYGNADPNNRKSSWDMLKRALMDDFYEVIDELSLVDLKTDNGWFTWVNNREGTAMVKERLDHFLISTSDVESFPFIKTKAEAKNIIRSAWKMYTGDIMDKLEKVGHDLGAWKFKKYKMMSRQIDMIKSNINKIIDRAGERGDE
ncbi:hypothetical protein GOBAR_AA34986 [Gossypium barbadense]|uniref:Uncharacterized protein n=1 Tax=Gossypium barbadense TaxID=3634 RepID=A0A2P5W3K5_GOSBA|nr:hypothetical protein GOBAR_AA34986 [Gossypium barbadense]